MIEEESKTLERRVGSAWQGKPRGVKKAGEDW